jgi:tellurite resistance protein
MSLQPRSLLARIASRLGNAGDQGAQGPADSILVASANLYGSRSAGGAAGEAPAFDADAAALFEAVVEAAYLVANADGVFDDTERAAFHQVVLTACGDAIPERQITALMADLASQLEEDGIDKRVRMTARAIATAAHAREVLRIAALIAHISEGVSEVEREVMVKLARHCELEPTEVDRALEEVKRELAR